MALEVATYSAEHLGKIPLQSHHVPTASRRAYAWRPANNGLVVLVLYGFNPNSDQPEVQQALGKIFDEFPALNALAIEYFTPLRFESLPDGSFSPRKALYLDRQTLSRGER